MIYKKERPFDCSGCYLRSSITCLFKSRDMCFCFVCYDDVEYNFMNSLFSYERFVACGL